MALNSTALGIWSVNKGKITTTADTVAGEKYIPVLVNDGHLKTSSGVKTQSNSIALAKPVNIDIDNPLFTENIIVDDGKGWDLNLVGGGSLLPLTSNSTKSFTYSDNGTRLIFDTGNSQTVPTDDDSIEISDVTYYLNANNGIYYPEKSKAISREGNCTAQIVDMAGDLLTVFVDNRLATVNIDQGSSPDGCGNSVNVVSGSLDYSTKPNGTLEFGSLNQSFTDSEISDQYGLKVVMKVNSGNVVVGLSSPSYTAYSEVMSSSTTVQTVNVSWRDLLEKPNKIIIGVVGKSFDINLYFAQLFRPVVSNFSTISIGGRNVDQYTKIIPHEKYFYYPDNQSFESKLASNTDEVAFWKTATTNFDVPPPPPPPGGTTTSTTAGVTTVTTTGPPSPPPPPGETTTTTSVSVQGDSGPPSPPTPPSTSFIENVKAQSNVFTSSSINQPRININETADANNIVQSVSDGVKSLHFNGTNINSTTNSFLVDFVYQNLGDDFTNNFVDFPDFSFELNADIKVIKGKVVAGVSNSDDIKGKTKISSTISPSEITQHLVLPVSNKDINKNKYDMIVVGSVQGLAEFYLDNVYLTITDKAYDNSSSYVKYRFAGSTDNINWDLAKWGNFEKPVGENHIVTIDPDIDLANGSQFVRVQSALYSEDPHYVPGVESFDLYFTEKTSVLQSTTTTTAIGATTNVNTTTTTTEPTITLTNPKTPETNNSFSKLVATGGVLWVNLVISMSLSAIVTWLIFRKKKLSPTE